MAITDPQAVRFVNEQVRPLCEQARALIARIDAAQISWFAGLNVLFPNDATALTDGRVAEGVSQMTGADINSAMNIMGALKTASNAQIVGKPCVRPLSAS